MKKMQLLLCVHIALSLSVAAQDCDVFPMIVPDGKDLKYNFEQRSHGYQWKKSKKGILDSFVKAANRAVDFSTEFNYPVGAVLDMIDACRTGQAAQADGVRMYLVAITSIADPAYAKITKNMINQVVPVWVPTTGGVYGRNILMADGTPLCYYMVPGTRTVIQLSRNAIVSWRDNYKVIHERLDRHIRTTSTKYGNETWHLWYDMEKLSCFYKYLKDNHVPKLSLQFIAYNETDLRNFKAERQVFRDVDVSRQLSIVFHVSDEEWAKLMQQRLDNNKKLVGDTVYDKMTGLLNKIRFELKHKKQPKVINALQKQFLSLYKTYLMDDDFDTGLPCPPDNNCVPLEP